jgi:PAS domain S-box-containing protein
MRIFLNAKIALQRKIAWLLIFSLFTLFFVGWLIYFSKKNIEKTTSWIDHAYTVIQQIEEIKVHLSGWQQPNRQGFTFYETLGHDRKRIQQLTVDNPDQQPLIGQLSAQLFQLKTTGDNRRVLNAMNSTLDEMMQQERDLLYKRQLKNEITDTRINILLIGASLLAFSFIVIILLRLNRDIVLRRQAEGRLKENQAWLQSILDNSTSLMYIKDPFGRYIMTNRRFREVLQVEDAFVLGRTDRDFSEASAADHYQRLDDEVIRTGKSLEIEEVVDSGGKEVHLLSIKFPLLDNNGRQIGIGGIATDITERVHYQQQLISATREAQKAKEMQELFLANMSHEIRTPMNGIQGMTDLLLDTSLSDQQKEFARIIKRSVNNLLVIINDILDFSKIKAGKLAIEKIDFRLKDVLDNVKAIFDHRVKKKGLILQVTTDPAIPDSLRGDPYRLNQVLINLIGNAVKFTEKGTIKVHVGLDERDAGAVNLQFTVADTGIGIPESSLPYIFDHFSQGGLDISRRYGGTGLGLAISHRLVQLQGGSITVKSAEGVGSVFSFELSYGYDPAEGAGTPAAAVTAVLADYSQCLAGRRFLVAEDNEVNQQLVDHVLRRGGGLVQLAGNGEQAVKYLQEGGHYDLVIMDLQMPVMDGYAATQYIRGELQLQIPIIAMTATALIGEQLRCFEVGMNDYMTKPFEFTDLYKRIISLLDNPRAYPDYRALARSGPVS